MIFTVFMRKATTVREIVDAAMVIDDEVGLSADQRNEILGTVLSKSGLTKSQIEFLLPQNVVEMITVEERRAFEAVLSLPLPGIGKHAKLLYSIVATRGGKLVLYDEILGKMYGAHPPKYFKTLLSKMLKQLNGRDNEIGGKLLVVHGKGLRLAIGHS